MKLPNGTITDCFCTQFRDCTPTLTPTPNCVPGEKRCVGNTACTCIDGITENCVDCPNLCSNGMCCYRECHEECTEEIHRGDSLQTPTSCRLICNIICD